MYCANKKFITFFVSVPVKLQSVRPRISPLIELSPLTKRGNVGRNTPLLSVFRVFQRTLVMDEWKDNTVLLSPYFVSLFIGRGENVFRVVQIYSLYSEKHVFPLFFSSSFIVVVQQGTGSRGPGSILSR